MTRQEQIDNARHNAHFFFRMAMINYELAKKFAHKYAAGQINYFEVNAHECARDCEVWFAQLRWLERS